MWGEDRRGNERNKGEERKAREKLDVRGGGEGGEGSGKGGKEEGKKGGGWGK